ncbi:hypothetical protein [Leptospira kobayashii]|nr:hypothetical protein [Leptospira kobayashii]
MKKVLLSILLVGFSFASVSAICPGKEKRSESCPGKDKYVEFCPGDGK